MITLLLLITSLSAYCQKAYTFSEAKLLGVETNKLDSLYKSACHTDTSLAVFGSQQDAFIESYTDFLRSLSRYMNENGCLWSETFKGFHKIYFSKEGRVIHYLYNYRTGFSLEKEEQFHVLLNQFILQYQFPLTAGEGFAQCGSVTFEPNNSN